MNTCKIKNNRSVRNLDLLKGEENNSFKGDISLPHVCTNNAQSLNQLRSLEEEYDTLLSHQDSEILSF